MMSRRFGQTMVLVLTAGIACPCAAQVWGARLDGASESPPVATSGSGSARLTLDPNLMTLRVEAAFAEITGTTTAAHLHCCTADAQVGNAAVASTTPNLPGFPLGVAAGSYDVVLDLTNPTSYSPSFLGGVGGGTVAGAYAALVAGLAEGRLYLNVHSTVWPSGEIRGFLLASPVFADGFEEL